MHEAYLQIIINTTFYWPSDLLVFVPLLKEWNWPIHPQNFFLFLSSPNTNHFPLPSSEMWGSSFFFDHSKLNMFVCWSQPQKKRNTWKIVMGYCSQLYGILFSKQLIHLETKSWMNFWTKLSLKTLRVPKSYFFMMALEPVCHRLIIPVSTWKCPIFIRLILRLHLCSYLWSDILAVPARCCHSSLMCDSEVVRWGTQITPPTHVSALWHSYRSLGLYRQDRGKFDNR